MRSDWRLRLLGSFHLERDGSVVTTFARRRQDVVLARLALTPTQAYARVAIANLLWPDKDRRHALNRLTEVLTLLNKQLAVDGVEAEVIAARYQTIRLGTNMRTDVQDFEDILAAALREPEADRQVDLLEQAVELHGTGLLPVLDDPWVVEERARLVEARDYAARLLSDRVADAPVMLAGEEGGLPPKQLAHYLVRGRQLADSGSDLIRSPQPLSHPDILVPPAIDEGVEWPQRQTGRELAESMVRLVEAAEPYLVGPERASWMDRLDAKRQEIYESIGWAIEHERTEVALRLTGALWRYWYARQRIDEGRLYLDQALALVIRPEGKWYAKAAHGAGGLALHAGDLEIARRRFEAALPIWREMEDGVAIGQVLDNLAGIAYKEGKYDEAREIYDKSLRVLRHANDPQLLVTVLRNAAANERAAGRPAASAELYRERLAIGKELGDDTVVAWSLMGLLPSVRERDGNEAAEALVREAKAHFEGLGEYKGVAICLRALGFGEYLEKRYDAARTYFDCSLTICKMQKDVGGIGESIRYLASVAEAEGDNSRALGLYRKALLILEDTADHTNAQKVRAAISEIEPSTEEAAQGRA